MQAIGPLMSIFGGISAKGDADSAAKEQQMIAEQNAQNIAAETARQEEVSRGRFEEDDARNKALAAASGTTGEGSQAIFQGAQKDKFNKEIEWLARSSKSRQEIVRSGGRYAAQTTRNQGKQALWGGISGAMSAWS